LEKRPIIWKFPGTGAKPRGVTVNKPTQQLPLLCTPRRGGENKKRGVKVRPPRNFVKTPKRQTQKIGDMGRKWEKQIFWGERQIVETLNKIPIKGLELNL